MPSSLKYSLYLIIVLASLVLTGCGGGGGGTGGTRNLPPIVSNTSPITIDEGSTARLTISASDPDGSIREIRWLQLDGPRISFTGGNEFIEFVVPEVTENTDIIFSVDVVDDFGAITSINITTTIVNITKALIITEIPAANSWSDSRWIKIQNNSDSSVNLKDYLLRTDALKSVEFLPSDTSDSYYVNLPDFNLPKATNIIVSFDYSEIAVLQQIDYTVEKLLFVETSESIRPFWNANGFVEILAVGNLNTIDFVRFGLSKETPFTDKVNNFSYIDQPLIVGTLKLLNGTEWTNN